MINCSKCKKPIKDDDRCYQVRYGYWVEHDAQDSGEFEAEEDTHYYHEECFPIEIE